MLRRSLLCAGILLLGACNQTDPYMREGSWRPHGTNDANLRAMLVSPSDLVRGVAGAGSDGQQAAVALDRYRNDKTRRLPDSGVAKIVPVATGSSQQGAP